MYFQTCTQLVCGLRFVSRKIERCPQCGSDVEYVTPALVSENSDFRCSPLTEVTLVLDNIRSAHNVGSILRTCAAWGVPSIICGGITPLADNAKVAKISLGAEKVVATQRAVNTAGAVQRLQKNGCKIYVAECIAGQGERLDETSPIDQPTAFVFGSEMAGVDPHIVSMADKIVTIPQTTHKKSFNVSVAVGVVLSSVSP